MAINQTGGKSVYLTKISKRFNPQYVATREIIHRYSKTKSILELAGGPLNSTGLLAKYGYKVTNLELDETFKGQNSKNFKNVEFVKCDL